MGNITPAVGRRWLLPTMTHLYDGMSGFVANGQTNNNAVELTYGELTFDGMEKLLGVLDLQQDDVLVDVGSGIGKLVIYTVLATSARVIGIEVSPERFIQSVCVYESPEMEGVRDRVALLNMDATNADVSVATVLYMCATCFPDDLIRSVVERVREGVLIVSSRCLPGHLPLSFVQSVVLPCTWNDRVVFYLYRKRKFADTTPR